MLEESNYEVIHLVRTRKGFNREFVWDFLSPLPDKIPFCDVIIHLASHVDFSLNIDIKQYNVNTVSTMRLADYAKSRNAYFILASMTGIHGWSRTLVDKFSPVNPDNNYSMSKYLAEEVVKTFVDNYSILRICGIYGLDGPKHLGLNRAINDAVHKGKLPVLCGSGSAKRNYICVLDVAGWIMYLVKHFKIESAAKRERIQEILYMSGPEIMTIEDYLQTIVDIVFPKMDVKRIEGDDPMDYVAKTSPSPFTLVTFREYIKSLLS